MKIIELKLLAFGPFTNKILELGDGQEGLHIIYGPNEAGKTSSLRALRQMLYGIDTKSSDNFIHSYEKLRIGAILRRTNGSRLEFVRRKGRINTLRTLDDETLIDESELKSFLGGVDEDLFTTMFGIDHANLVKGGEEIIQGGGNIGQMLFAAGSGISDLRKVRNGLQNEADNLFKPSGKKPLINEVVSRLRKNKKEVREAQLSGQKWVEHDQSLSKALNSKQSYELEREYKLKELSRLGRIKEALPVISRRKKLLEDLKTCADAVILPKDFGNRRKEALTKLKIEKKIETEAEKNIEKIEQRLMELNVPEYLLNNAKLIEQLYLDFGSHKKAQKDRTGLVIRKNSAKADAIAILKELKGGMALDQAKQMRLGKAESVRIKELSSSFERLTVKNENISDEIEKLSIQADQLSRKISKLERPTDTTELGEAIRQALRHGDLEEIYNNECKNILKAEKSIKTALKREPLWKGPFERFEKLPVPSLETIDRFEHQFSKVELALEKYKSEEEKLQRTLLNIEGQIKRLKLEQEVPTEDDLRLARLKRDEGWHLVLREWKEKEKFEEDIQKFAASCYPAKSLDEAYELSVKKADTIADRLRREADRVAKKASLIAEREECGKNSVRLKDLLAEAETEHLKIKQQWTDLWKDSDISPKSPREMRAWVQDWSNLSGQISVVREQKEKAYDLKEEIESCRLVLTRQIELLVKSMSENGKKFEKKASLSYMVEKGHKIIDHFDKIRSEYNQLIRDQKQRLDELEEAKSRHKKIEHRLSKWKSDWAKALQPLGLGEDTSPVQAVAVLEDMKAIFSKLKEANDLDLRIQGIDKDSDDFYANILSLAGQVAPDLKGYYPVEQIAVELNTRLTDARTAKTEQKSLNRQNQQEKKRLMAARRKISEINSQLEAMCDEAGCKTFEDLSAAEEMSSHRRQTTYELEQQEKHLHGLSGGAMLDKFIQDAEAIDPDSIDPKMRRLEDEIEQIENQISDLDQTIGKEKSKLDEMDGSSRAAILAEEAQGLLGILESNVKQYARLKLASLVLNKAIERYREKNQEPVLRRSTELFSHMTLGSFVKLRPEFNENGEAIIVGLRKNSPDNITVHGMSDGTVDQLYLAIRLASLEAYLERNEPIPFIVDDILIKFDDRRSIATLEVLAEIAQKTQIIFFTHHMHLVELAKSNLKKDSLFLHYL